MLAQEIQKAQTAFTNNPYNGSNFRHFAEGWLMQAGSELAEAIAAVDDYLQIAEEADNELYNAAWDTYCCLVEDEGVTHLTFDEIYAAVVRHNGDVDTALAELI